MSLADFAIDRKFDIILCMYDSINHLEEYQDWINTFGCAYNHLNPGGVFIFDMNTMEKLDHLARSTGSMQHADGVYVFTRISRMNEHTVNWSDKIFTKVRDNLYELTEDTITETAFPLPQVRKNLEEVFDRVHIRTHEEDPTLARGRAFFSCQA